MKGLLRKDFYIIRRYARLYLMIILVYGILAVYQQDFGFISGINVAMFSVIPLTTLSYDGSCKWNSYALSSPVSRKTLALEKYLFSMILCFVGMIITLLTGSLIVLCSHHAIAWTEVFGTMAGQFAATLLITGISLPAAFRFGPEKARYIMMLSFLIPFIAVLVLFHDSTLPSLSISWAALGVLAGVCLIIVLLISILLSVRICEQMEA